MTGTGGISPQAAGTEISIVEETGNASSAGNNRACSDGESRKNRGGNGVPETEGRVCSTKLICHGGGQKQ